MLYLGMLNDRDCFTVDGPRGSHRLYRDDLPRAIGATAPLLEHGTHGMVVGSVTVTRLPGRSKRYAFALPRAFQVLRSDARHRSPKGVA